jgi:hypothetical protein
MQRPLVWAETSAAILAVGWLIWRAPVLASSLETWLAGLSVRWLPQLWLELAGERSNGLELFSPMMALLLALLAVLLTQPLLGED